MSAVSMLSAVAPWLSLWGAVLATVLFTIKLWETFWKDRMRLETSYSFTSLEEEANEITIANLRSTPVQVSSWKLEWEPAPFRWFVKSIDVTPDWDRIVPFKIDGHSTYTLELYQEEGFRWGAKVEQNRQLCLSLRVFGHRKRKRLIISRR